MRAFAESIGKSVQWARKLKREGAPQWQAFLAAQVAGSAEVLPQVRGGGVSAALPLPSPDEDLKRALEAKHRAWVIFDRSAAAAERGSSVVVEQVSLNRAAKEARDAYEKACKHAAAAAQAAGQWVGIDRVAAIRSAIRQLEDVVQNWETSLAGQLPDDMRPRFHEAFAASRPAWNKGVRRVDEYISTLLPMPC